MQRFPTLFSFLLSLAGVGCIQGGAIANEPVSFSKDVWPIFAVRCVECHGAEKQEGKLRLDSPDDIYKGGEYGAIVVAGDVTKSTLYELVTKPHLDPDRMPNKGEPLDPKQIATLKAWIEQGAKTDGWSADLLKLVPVKDTTPVVLPAANELPQGRLTYNRDVRPLLSNFCFPCHGPDKGARKADLRLDKAEVATALRADGVRPIAPGKLSESEAARRLFHSDPGRRMPPSDQQRQPTDTQRRIIAAWILQGAVYEPHWSFIAPRKVDPPRIAGLDHPIDRFIAARLDTEGLKLSPQADPIDLVRRLSFDLIGLPPTLEQVAAFERDHSDAAYEKLVDELLASPHYGERMAMHWLDLVRYADTNGYHTDETRKVWAYRDWVIDAFNSNKRYDTFAREQIAGDLLPNATRDQLIASSYNRMNQITAEGGAQPREYLAKYAADRVRNVSSVWLGATLGCAECHDHKFDPFLSKDFYSMAAFFADMQEFGVYTTGEQWAPVMLLPTAAEQAEMDEMRAAIARTESAIASTEVGAAWQAWEGNLRKGAASAWHPVWPLKAESEAGATLTTLPDYSVLARGATPAADRYTVTFGKIGHAAPVVRMELLGDPSMKGWFARGNPVGVELSEVVIEHRGADRVWHKANISFVNDDVKDGTKGPQNLFDGLLDTRWYLKPDHAVNARVTAVFTLALPLPAGDEVRVSLDMRGAFEGTTVGRFRISLSDRADAGFDNGAIGEPMDLVDAIVSGAALDVATEVRASNFYRATTTLLADQRNEVAALYEKIFAKEKEINSTLLTRAVDTPRVTRVLPRGNWMSESGDVVQPNVPEFLPRMQIRGGRRPTRLDLAEWIASKDNPLTARAFVNRLWKLYFGRGISRVLDDLGAQGEWPTHPELLDWLAVEFRESGWDIKHVVRLMVTSRAYRQTSRSNEDLRERDPGNTLYARQSRTRLEAEMIRDTTLSVAGLLSQKIGGPTVRPYQPDGYWRDATIPGSQPMEYKPSEGEDQYRRGLYTYWKRSFLHPAMLAFDAPTREECTAQRPISNTPVQALVLLNDPSYVEAARAFAERIVAQGGGNPKDRIDWAVRQALSRTPNLAEIAVLEKLYAAHKNEYSKDIDGAAKLIAVGQHPAPAKVDAAELAAWTSVARTILNLPEFITRF